MGRLIEDLLDVARIEAGALVVRPSSEEPRPVLLEVQSMFEQQASQAGVSLSVGSVCDAPIRMDRDRTMQALANLVENAIRVTAEGGSVTLGAKALDENLVALSVADTGTGLAPEVVQHLFDRFWQGEGKGGSGLGLAIVRGVAEAHGGEVRVDSELGVGSTFHLVLPRA
jgi:signal transduction histidine kinase